MMPSDRTLLHQLGTGSIEGYLYGGFTVALGLRSALRLVDVPRTAIKRVLDFGCGSGRVVRWFQDWIPASRISAVDINEPALEWCRHSISGVEFKRAPIEPPLPYGPNEFDFIFGVSVLTHFDEELQVQWLGELQRICRPGGYVFLSIHGPHKADRDLAGSERTAFESAGFFFRRPPHDGSLEGMPDFYQVTYHSHAYVERVWANYFDVIGIIEHGPLYYQDLVILRKKPASPSRVAAATAQAWKRDLPIAMLELPPSGVKINADEIEVSGWAFQPAGGAVALSVWLDDVCVGQCSASERRPDVAEHFHTHAAAEFSGFRCRLSLRRLKGGVHMIWLSLANDAFPLCATFFVRDPRPVRVMKRVIRSVTSRNPQPAGSRATGT